MEKVFRVRYRDKNGLFRSRLFLSSKPDGLGSKVPGRVLKVGKVGKEELFHIGSNNELPKLLMKEFRENRYKQKEVFRRRGEMQEEVSMT